MKNKDFLIFWFFHVFLTHFSKNQPNSCFGNQNSITIWLISTKKSPKSWKKSKNRKSLIFQHSIFYKLLVYQKLLETGKKWNAINWKNFLCFLNFDDENQWFGYFCTVFGSKCWNPGTKIREIHDFFEKSLTSNRLNFLFSERILIIFDFLERSISNSFISGVF